jgi:branched-chain amino acid transport system permease protein
MSSLDVDMTPTMGMRPLMMGIVASIIGGMRSITGIAIGAVILGVTQNLAVVFVASEWQDVIAFVILIAFLLVRPEGVMGKKSRKATV